MKASHVRLAALDGMDPERIYRLNWIKGCRWEDGRLEVQAVFVAESAHDPGNHLYRWIKASDFPFLILDSRWYRGTMVGKPLGRRLLAFESANTRAHGVTSSEVPNKLNLSPGYALASDSGNSPVLELAGHYKDSKGREPCRIYVPLSEVYRSHYFSIPTALPSILGGLINSPMSNSSLEAWNPEGTGWIDEGQREARITPSDRLTQALAKRLARTIFSKDGAESLRTIHKWVQRSFATSHPRSHQSPRAWLPLVNLPYDRATWDASVVKLPSDQQGRTQLLVLHIDSFDAPEPYRELEIVTPATARGSSDGSISLRAGGKTLEPDPQGQIDDIELGWDPSLEPIEVEDVIATDERARRRIPRVAKTPASPSASAGKKAENVAVVHGSTQAFGRSDRLVAPLVFTDDDAASDPRPGLQDSLKAIRHAIDSVVATHRERGIEAYARMLPNDAQVYEFRVPASDTPRARHVAVPRQFIIAEVCIGRRYAYVVEPERRTESQPLPLGVLWLVETGSLPSHRALGTDDLHGVVQQIETSARDGHSWIRSVQNHKRVQARRIIHAAGTPPDAASLLRFSNRISSRLLTVVGDVRVI